MKGNGILNKHETKIPPPVVAALILIAMWLVRGVLVPMMIPMLLRLWIGIFFGAFGVLIAGMGMIAFRRAQTTINPVNPGQASRIVTGSVYRFTRNPMYVGLTAALLSFMAWFAVPWLLIGPVLFVLYIDRFQIIPEERALRLKFGAEYEEYVHRVRRWI
jgi:protein-S-isoprenylcysteine O-methyltransferase Ste14